MFGCIFSTTHPMGSASDIAIISYYFIILTFSVVPGNLKTSLTITSETLSKDRSYREDVQKAF